MMLGASYAQIYFTTKSDSKKEKKTELNLTKQNKNNYSSSLSLKFVLCMVMQK